MYMLCNSFILSFICNNLLLHQEVTLPHRVVCVKKKNSRIGFFCTFLTFFSFQLLFQISTFLCHASQFLFLFVKSNCCIEDKIQDPEKYCWDFLRNILKCFYRTICILFGVLLYCEWSAPFFLPQCSVKFPWTWWSRALYDRPLRSIMGEECLSSCLVQWEC